MTIYRPPFAWMLAASMLAGVLALPVAAEPGDFFRNLFEAANNQNDEEDEDDGHYHYHYNYIPPPPRVVVTTPGPAAPKQTAVKVAAKTNSINITIRQATRSEVNSLREQMITLQEDIIANLEDALTDALPSTTKLLGEMVAKEISADSQAQILQALKSRNADQVQILWITLMKDPLKADELQRQIAVDSALYTLRENAGDLVLRDTKHLKRMLDKLDAGGNVRRESDKYIKMLESTITMLADLGDGSLQTRREKIAIPLSISQVLCNPKLTAGTIISLGSGSFMLGTGGQGKLEILELDLAAALGYTVVDAESIQPFEGEEITGGTILRCTKVADIEVEYRIFRPSTTTQLVYDEDGNAFNQAYASEISHSYKMKPGDSQILADEGWKIDFNRGGSFGRTTYPLKPGTFEFRPSDRGWECYHLPQYTVTVDNDHNKHSFEYVINNKTETVQGGTTRVHKTNYPMSLRFHRGGAASNEKTVRLEGGHYDVAIAADGMWDVFTHEALDAAH